MMNVEIANEEMVPRVKRAILNLAQLEAGTTDPKERERLGNKIAGVQATLATHHERFRNMRTPEDLVTLAAMVAVGVEPQHVEGAALVQGYLMDYYDPTEK
jgi:hypothetical protein